MEDLIIKYIILILMIMTIVGCIIGFIIVLIFIMSDFKGDNIFNKNKNQDDNN